VGLVVVSVLFVLLGAWVHALRNSIFMLRSSDVVLVCTSVAAPTLLLCTQYTRFDACRPKDLPLEQKENIGMKITGDSGSNHFVIRDGDVWLVEGTNGLVYNYTCIKDEITSC
jgi:hypothetical protein